MIHVFTDGACQRNPGPGGWAALVRYPNLGRLIELSGYEPLTTNNRMELMGPIRALEYLRGDKMPVTITSDSQYVVKGASEWIHNWKRRGWVTGSGEVKNQDLWEQLDGLQQQHRVSWQWVRGHSGHRENEYADWLAVDAISRRLSSRVKAPVYPADPASEWRVDEVIMAGSSPKLTAAPTQRLPANGRAWAAVNKSRWRQRSLFDLA